MLKVGTLCWTVAPRGSYNKFPGVVGKIAEVLSYRPDHYPELEYYRVLVEGKTWLAQRVGLLPFSDPDQTRPEFEPKREPVTP